MLVALASFSWTMLCFAMYHSMFAHTSSNSIGLCPQCFVGRRSKAMEQTHFEDDTSIHNNIVI